MTEFMRNTDAFTWAMESDPGLRSTVIAIALLDRTPDWGQVVDRFDEVSRVLPIFRQRVVESPPLVPPRWEISPDFDLGFHMRRVTAPAPGTFDTVLEMARLAEMSDFDRARPLWEVTLIDGLDDGGAALLCKLHHSLTDGVGGVQIAMLLLDQSGTPRVRMPIPPEPQMEAPSSLREFRDAVRYHAGILGQALTTSVRSGPGFVLNAVRRPVQTAASAGAIASSVYRTVRPITRTGSPLMTDRKLLRRLGVHEVSLPRLRAAGRGSGGSVNDAFLAGVTGGLRRYHEKHGVTVGDLHMTMPISLRTDIDAMGGNRITLMRYDVPVALADPARRIAEIHKRAIKQRSEKSLPYTQLIAGAMNLVPRWYIGSVLRRVDLVASNVPGIPVPVSLGGAAVRMQYGFGPTIGSAVNVTLMSYVETCALGINVDTGAISDYDVFHDCLVAGFDEVVALAA
jgi:diacylglycerol O-acyltransferase / wax synthase